MQPVKFKSALIKSALAATVLALASGASFAQTVVNLTAKATTTTLPDGSVVPMWGLFCNDAGTQGTCAGLNPANPTAATTGSWSPPVITVPLAPAGTATTLTINLTNSLTFGANNIPTSLVIVGQLGGGLGVGATSTASPDHSNAQQVTWPIASPGAANTPPTQGPRVQSFATEVAATGATLVAPQVASGSSLVWSNLSAGTYLIESGTHPSIQGPMGLYGILVVTSAPSATSTTGCAYPDPVSGACPATAAYSAEVPLLLSEIDPVQNNAVNTAVNTAGFSETMVWSGLPGGCGNPASPTLNQCYPPAVNYTPLYYTINGVAFDTTHAGNSLFAATTGASTTTPVAGTVLVRMVNAGLRMHVPSIVGSQTGTTGAGGLALLAEDGNVLPGVPRVQNEVFMAAGKTYDVLINVPAAAAPALPVFDRQLSLSGNATQRNAGMLAYIGVNGATLPAAPSIGAATAVADTYNSLVAGQTFTVSDPATGVMHNDVRVYGVALDTTKPAAHGTVTLNANGTFTYVPSGTATSDSFGYCANGTTTICTTVTLGAAPLESASGITLSDMTFNSQVGAGAAPARFAPPGVLAGAVDGAGYPLTVDATTVSALTGPGTGTLTIQPDGSFAAAATAAGSYTFTYKAKNSQGVQSAKAATVTVVFPAPSGLKVTVLDGHDHVTSITDYRWIIEEDRTFFVDPKCTTNPLPAGCPVAVTTASGGAPVNYGTNFHTSYMPVVASGCTGALSCEGGQTLQTVATVCDTGNGVCHPGTQQTAMDPSQVPLDPTKRYYISILPGDAANPFVGANASAPANCAQGPYNADGTLNTDCGHGMGGAPIAAGATTVTVLTIPTPLPTATLSVFVFEDDYPLNGEQGSGGGVDVLAPNEPGLGNFQVTIFDVAGGTGDATGQPTYDMFNQPLSNSLAGTIDPVTGLDACPISNVVTNNALHGDGTQKGITGMIVTCPKYESDGQTLSPMAGQATVKNLYPGRYGVAATPGADRIARGEEWLQTNTLDGQKAHDSFMRVGEPGYFQEFGPAGYHVSIGFANPQIINERRFKTSNGVKSGMCDPAPIGGGLACNWEVKGQVTGSRLSRSPDQRLYGSGDRSSLAFTQCYASLGDPDGAEIALVKCDANGNFDFTAIPPGNWKVTLFDQWNDQIIDGITQPVAVGCTGTINGNCTHPTATSGVVDMGEIAVHQWQADIYTRTFIDLANTGVSDGTQPGLPLAATNIRFRDGSYSNFNNTDLDGYAGFNEVFPLFNWYVIETDTTAYKTTGVHVVYDAGGPADGSSPGGTPCAGSAINPCGSSSIGQGLANTYEPYPLPSDLSVPGAVYCPDADCGGLSIAAGPKPSSITNHSTGRIDPPFWFGSYGWQGFIGQGNFLEWGKKPFAKGETGPIHGHVVYASTRPFDDPQLLLQLSWEPLVPHVRVNLYREDVAADGVTKTLTLVDHTDTSSWDDWAQGFYPGTSKPYMSCPGQTTNDPFYYGLQNQPQYLDWYNNVLHGTAPAPTALPHNAQYKCYDGMHSWNQLQPAPYDGMYTFPSVTGLSPTTGKPTGTNCTACTTNPDSSDPYHFGTPMLPPGKYVVEVVVPPGYELVKEEDKNILIGDNYIAPATVQFPGLAGAVYILPDQAQLAATYNATNPLNSTASLGRMSSLPSHEGDTGSVESYWPCVGAVRQVPDFISLFPQSGENAPFAGAMRPLCDRKEVTLTEQASALVKFYIFSSTHVASHFQGIILDDFTAEFDPFSPQFGEKFAPSYLPVGVKDWTGNEINRVYADQFGLYNGLNYSTWEVNPPNPTGYGPTMMVMCMNDAGLPKLPNGQPDPAGKPDPLFQPGYSQFCYELPFMPGQTGYFDTPVVPVQAFSEGYNHPDCAYPDATPAIGSVIGDDPTVPGPWVSAPGKTLTINALPDQSVDWYGYTGPAVTTVPYNQAKVTRHYGFGTTPGTVKIGNVTVPSGSVSWGDTVITLTVPMTPTVQPCAVQQQGAPAASCGQLLITTAGGKQSIDTVTVTIGGNKPTVLAAGQSIQDAIDKANPGDMIIVPPGTYNEMLVMWKPVRLQGVGAAVSVIDANTQPAGTLLDKWRTKVVCLFGLTTDGRPRDVNDTACSAGLTGATNHETGTGWTNFPTMIVDRLPFEATLGWDASLNGNLAEQLSEPSLLGAYEGAAITVAGKGVKFPSGTLRDDAFGATTGAAFPANTTLLSAADCGSSLSNNPYPTNFYCNPSSIDGLGIRDSSQGGGGIFVHAYAHNLQIANNRVHNNTGTMSGGITIGAGEHPDVALANAAVALTYPGSCETSTVTNLSLPFCFNMAVNIHHNAVVGNSSMGDELFSSTPAGAGGVSINTGSDYYHFTNNWVCGNISTGDGGGFAHIGFIKNGDISHNTIIFNQSTNPTITTNGGGLLVMGAPDADPTTCGVTTDQDCVPAPTDIAPSDGTGPGLKINANLILGNAADSGSGGGLRLQAVNGGDVLNFPAGASACSADLGTGANRHCYWNSVNVTNNIIANNVAGWDGAGVSLLDALAVNIVNNTITANDSTASSGTLFQSLFAPLASSASPTTNVTCQAGAQSCPQVAGLVSVHNSPVLEANIGQLPATPAFSCPPGHGTGTISDGGVSRPACVVQSIPLMFNDVIWQNRSFFIGVGGFGTAASGQNQQKIVTLYNAFTTAPAGTQNATGGCPTGSSYWEMGFRGDTTRASHAANGFAASSSVLTATTYGGSANLITDPAFTSHYCNGSRTPPELGVNGWQVPPGTNEANAYPNPVFSLTPSAVVDEGNNWINLRWGPLSLYTVGSTAPSYTGTLLGNYMPVAGSSAIDAGSNGVTAGGVTVAPPSDDFFGTTRPVGTRFDIGAVEAPAGAAATADLSVTKVDNRGGSSITSTTGAVGAGQTLVYTIVVTNNGPSAVANATLTDTLPGTGLFTVTATTGWTCVTTGGATCTPAGTGNVTRTATMSLPVNATATFTLSGTVPAAAAAGTMTNRVSVATPATVTDPNTANNTASDTTAIARPAITSVTPNSGTRGTSALPITITGTGLTGSTGVTVSGAGVTCSGVSAPNDTTVTATCSITSAAGLTARSVTVTGGSYGNTPAFANAFTVTGATATISAPTPALNTGGTGTKTGTITVSNATASTGPLTLTAAPAVVKTAGNAASAFTITGGTCANGTVVNPGGSCTIVVQYAPGGVTTAATAHVSLANSGAATNPLNGPNFNGN